MKIADVRAYPTSFPLPPDASVTLGIGRAVKRDAVVVKLLAEIRGKIEQARRDAGPATTRTKITVTDASGTTRTYDSVDEMPPDIRQMYERALW